MLFVRLITILPGCPNSSQWKALLFIVGVDTTKYTCTVQTADSTFHDVALPIYGYTRGGGAFYTPSVGDWVLIIKNMRNQAFVVNMYPFNGADDLTKQFRENPVPQGYTIKSPKDITLKVETPTESGIIEVTTDSNGKVSMLLSINAMTKDSNGNAIVDTTQKLPNVVINDTSITATAKDGTNSIVMTTDGIQFNTGGTLSPVVTAAVLANMFTKSAVAAGDGGATLKTNMAAALSTLTSKVEA
jgi:hypothetical protein